MTYDPDPFYEASSVGPAVTFGAMAPDVAQSVFPQVPERTRPPGTPDQQAGVAPGFWAGLTPRKRFAVVAVASAAILGGAYLRRTRRRNPRRSRALPLMAVGAVGALLVWGGTKTVEAVKGAVPSLPPTPAKQGGVVAP